MIAASDVPLILAFDTATRSCSVALTRGGPIDGEVLVSLSLAVEITHSRRLLDSIDLLLREAGVNIDAVAAVAFGLGPGSFTGLRIGMVTAKGLCHGAGKPLVGIPSLDAIGCGVESDELICVVLDARKQEVYSGFYRRGQDGRVTRCGDYAVGPPETVARAISGSVVMAGDGVAAYAPIWRKLLGGRMREAGARYRYPSAAMIGMLAAAPLVAGDVLDLDLATPLYVRSSDAELSLVQPAGAVLPATTAARKTK
ncbi:MAG: tRNA (adenosine(37)-N6)-threonylcarbamoyltransferase complex dimerization subunit type 1 TsaB [Desulfobulbaceae bacterium]|nr:tRNA (adenosine(37)-N6)-threonylcarbamoyltransferase complex dimerization subunit type 1 TsaB [Desulfobulbaceae bacterium]